MSDTAALLQGYLEASIAKDIDAMATFWHDDCEGIYPLRPGRRWEGIDGFREVWTRMWEHNPGGLYEVVSTGSGPDCFYIEARIQLPNSTLIPSVNAFDVEGGKIRRVRVYADVPRPDDGGIEQFISGD